MHLGSSWLESFRFSFRAIRQNKLRSFLSVLGITIGIYCIIAVYALVHSMERSINNQFRQYGTEVLFVQKWPWDGMGGNYPWWKYLSRPIVTPTEAQFLRDRLPANRASAIAYSFSLNKGVQTAESRVDGVSIRCVDHAYAEIQKVNLGQGRYFSPAESRAGRAVAVIGADVAEALFGDKDPIGQPIRILNGVVHVIGVFEKEGASLLNNSADNSLLLPLKTGLGLSSFKNNDDAQIMIKAAEGVSLDDLQTEVEMAMRQIRHERPAQEASYAVNRMSMITEAVTQLFAQIQKVGVIIGAFAMLVGCFGVANILFVSVKERTQEIGIQKALGAPSSFIRRQFLLEAIWLCTAGGAVGLGFVGLTLMGIQAIAAQSLGNSVEIGLDASDALLGLLVSIGVGILSGFLPARSAARLNPVDAMRSK
jgi:putative ABC transport system permease protein